MRTGGWDRREWLAGTAALFLPGAAWARSTPEPIAPPVPLLAAPPAPSDAAPAPTLEELVKLELGQDDAQRMRVSVHVDGRGPFPFMVDTGADHSVVSSELAAALGLSPSGMAHVNGIAGARMAPCARIGRLDVGGVKLDSALLPLLPRDSLGGLGVVGLDALSGQRIEIDFGRKLIEVRRSHGIRHEAGELIVSGKSRFGKLILVDSSVRKTPIYVVLDSGAQNTLGNAALRALLYQRRVRAHELDPRKVVTLYSATGQTIDGETDVMPELRLGDVRMTTVPVIYADLHTFRMYGLDDEPALMLGMDVMRIFGRVSIDFARREVGFMMPHSDGMGLLLNPA